MELKVSWERIKWRIDENDRALNYEQLDDAYYFVWIQKKGIVLCANITGSDKTDFETNYKANANQA